MKNFIPVIEKLNSSDIRYVIVGGLAVVMPGHPRLTADIDIVLDFEPENSKRAMLEIKSLGYQPQIPVDITDFADSEKRRSWIETKNMRVFSVYRPENPLVRVDFFVEEPMPFTKLFDNSQLENLNGTEVRICSLDDLIEMKEQAGRAKDLADLEVLKILKDRQ